MIRTSAKFETDESTKAYCSYRCVSILQCCETNLSTMNGTVSCLDDICLILLESGSRTKTMRRLRGQTWLATAITATTTTTRNTRATDTAPITSLVESIAVRTLNTIQSATRPAEIYQRLTDASEIMQKKFKCRRETTQYSTSLWNMFMIIFIYLRSIHHYRLKDSFKEKKDSI